MFNKLITKNLLKNFFKKMQKILGRWNTVYDKKILDQKIYLANYDHCGPCGKLNLENLKIY